MGRLVQPAQLERVMVRGANVESIGATTVVAVGGDSYQDRLAKYIPGEVIAAYLALDRNLMPETAADVAKGANSTASAAVNSAGTGLLPQPAFDQATFHLWLPFLILIIGVIFTPLYIRQLAHNNGAPAPWRTQAVISTLAFLVWAYAIQGSAFTVGIGEQFHLYDGKCASALVILFTLASGLFSPIPVRSDNS